MTKMIRVMLTIRATAFEKQTRSIAMVMKKAMGQAKYFQFLEDDMLLCKGGLEAIHHMLSKASRYHHDWIALRTSYGMNGIFLHDKDMEHFHQYLLKNQLRRPPRSPRSRVVCWGNTRKW